MNLLKFLTKPFEKKEIVRVETPEEAPLEKRRGIRNPKLDEGQQLQLINYLAQGLTPSMVVEKIYQEYEIKVSTQNVTQYLNAAKWKDKIAKLREEYLNRLDLIDGSHKAVRIRRMEHIMEKAVKKGDLRIAISANEQTRKEFQNEDGNTTVYWNNPVYQQFNQLTNEQLIQKQKEATEKLKIKKESQIGPVRTSEKDSQ